MAAVLRPQLSDDGPDFAVLLVRRSQRASFMANAYVFPGGRVDAADAEVDPDSPSRYAAARELSEEAGLSVPDFKALVRFAHWITPTAEPKRFDADCYLLSLDWVSSRHGSEVKVDGREVFDPLWLTPREALSRYLAGELNLPPPTVCTIEELEAERLRALTSLRSKQALSSSLPTSRTDASRLVSELLQICQQRTPYPLLPKLIAKPEGDGIAIVMPWDPHFAELPGEGASWPGVGTSAPTVMQRISRCVLPLAKADETYAVRPEDSQSVRWQIERLPQ
jgi:8-oxo-dGTP pyrophosphatase MutT (NUDIX family)